jgi:hypothetical protein
MIKSNMKGLRYTLLVSIAALILTLIIGVNVFLSKEGEAPNSLKAEQTDAAMVSCFGGDRNDSREEWERRLQDEIIQAGAADEIFTLIQTPGFYPFGGNRLIIVRVRGERAIITWRADDARELYREMTEDEMEDLRSFIRKYSIDELGDFSEDCGSPKCMEYHYYLHLKRGGQGRRASISIDGTRVSEAPHHKLIELFSGLVGSGEFKACYKMRDKFPGLEVLFTGRSWGSLYRLKTYENYSVIGVCKSSDALRVLLQSQANSGELKTEWRDFDRGTLGGKLEPHTACPTLYKKGGPPSDLRTSILANIYQPQDALLYSLQGIMPDGKWVVAAKVKAGTYQLVRISLETRREYRIKSPYILSVTNITPVPSQYKALAEIEALRGKRGWQTEYRLIDPVTGASEKVTGDFRPLMIKTPFMLTTPRPLQPTGRPNEFWAAIARKDNMGTEIGRYDTAKFVFKPIINLPLSFNEIWVDEAEGKIYVVHGGDLLRLPLKQ